VVVGLVLAAIVALGLGVSVVDLATRPLFRHVAVRSLRRRRGEALLVVVGAALGTAVIGAAFVVGDSFDGSIRDIARTELGPIDVSVTITAPDELSRRVLQVEDRLSHSSLPATDGLLTAASAPAVLDNARAGTRQAVDPTACLLEVDLAGGRRFGHDPAITGLADAGSTPSGDEALITELTARVLDLGAGDRFVAHLYGESVPLRVRAVLPAVGIAGFCDVIVAQGTIARAAAGSGTAAAQPPRGMLWISARGGVFTDAADSDRIVAATEAALVRGDVTDAEVQPTKQDLLDRAERNGENLRTIFSGIGGFSVIAGVLLLVNLVVMLAEERKAELGILRAVGLKRNHLLRAFSLEGALYATAAAVLGALLAVGVAAGIVWGTQELFAEPDSDFRIRLFAHPTTLATAAAIGLGISMVTIWAASGRIARLNIIAAIRDLPDPRRHERRLASLIALVLVALGGVATTVAGVRSDSPVALLAGVPVACFALIGVAGRRLHRDATQVLLSVAAMAWALGVFGVFPDQMGDVGIAVFVVMGVLLVAAAVSVAVVLLPVWHHLLARGRHQGALAARLGLAYPLAHRFRTGLLLAMFSLVIFTMAFLSSFSSTIGTAAETAPGQMAAGTDLLLDTNRANPAGPDAVRAVAGVADVAPLVRGGATFSIRYVDEPVGWAVTGFDEALLRHGTPELISRDDVFADDRAAFEAVLDDPSLIIVNDRFLLRGDGPATETPRPGDRVSILDERSGRSAELRIAGVLRTDYIGHGALWSRTATEELLAPFAVANRLFVTLRAGTDPERAAAELTRALVANGGEARPFRAIVEDELSRTRGFMSLLQGYLGFGLLIGVAGLGVVLVRAVRERRREIGMLRAMGFPAAVVAGAFRLEAAFVALQGVLIGSLLAVATAQQVVVSSSAFGNDSVRFVVPWAALAVIVVVPVLAALGAAWWPARAAGRIRPAVALRISD